MHDALLADADLRGQILLGRYAVEALLARGGMSLVFSAHDHRLDRPACVKVFHSVDRQETYGVSRDHFVQEAFTLSRLSHPNTVRIFDYGTLDADGAPFYVCELLDGGTLSHRLRRTGALPTSEVVELVTLLAEALDEAHGLGIVHRDVKPANVLYGRAGSREVVKLADFSIAKAIVSAAERRPHHAEDTSVGGGSLSFFTTSWAAPEQFRRKPIGSRTDTYALGLLAAVSLLGRPIFPTLEPIELLRIRAEGERWLHPRLEASGLPPEIVAVIQWACRDELEARPTVLELADALAHAVGARSAARGESASPPIAARSLVRVPHVEGPHALPDGGRLVPFPVGETVDLGGPNATVLGRLGARVRASALGSSGQLLLKGLSCFVGGDRPSTAMNVVSDQRVRLVGNDARILDALEVCFARPYGDDWVLELSRGSLVLPGGSGAFVAVDGGPGRDVVLWLRSEPGHRSEQGA
ncbi:MAG: serine/threonine protein kinase [Myxococcota bacterium]|jgi:serine/threonine-protein kinase|nr:serine/threonine protein kinase [Myxococcota bacterium]